MAVDAELSDDSVLGLSSEPLQRRQGRCIFPAATVNLPPHLLSLQCGFDSSSHCMSPVLPPLGSERPDDDYGKDILGLLRSGHKDDTCLSGSLGILILGTKPPWKLTAHDPWGPGLQQWGQHPKCHLWSSQPQLVSHVGEPSSGSLSPAPGHTMMPPEQSLLVPSDLCPT